MPELLIRPYDPARDEAAVMDLLTASLGWLPDGLHRAFFDWKHHANPFGRSFAWVAVDGERVAGFRTFLRWRFERDGRSLDAVRAVDTATHPDYRGRGTFRSLTLHGLEELRAAGVAFVFNTPNDQSLPGYLGMGWREVGRPAVLVRPRSPSSLVRTLRARRPASLWSAPTDAGERAAEALGDRGAVDDLLASQPPPRGLRTLRSSEWLSWRYGFEPLRYRVMQATDHLRDGFAVFRLRSRGPALEAAVCEVLAPDGDSRTAGRLLRAVAARSGADHVVAMGGGRVPVTAGFRLPRQGPVLVWRSVNDDHLVPLRSWRLTLGDIELL